MIPFEFRRELWCQKTRVTPLSCGVICVILRLAVLIQNLSVIVVEGQVFRFLRKTRFFKTNSTALGAIVRIAIENANLGYVTLRYVELFMFCRVYHIEHVKSL